MRRDDKDKEIVKDKKLSFSLHDISGTGNRIEINEKEQSSAFPMNSFIHRQKGVESFPNFDRST